MDYSVLKVIHQSAVGLSFLGFFARGLGMLGDAAWINGRPARTLPHVVDTVLLLSALGLVWMLSLSPFASPWLAAKIIGLVVYILLGSIALKRGRSKRVRIAAWIAAMATFSYIVSVALTKDPRGFFAALGRDAGSFEGAWLVTIQPVADWFGHVATEEPRCLERDQGEFFAAYPPELRAHVGFGFLRTKRDGACVFSKSHQYEIVFRKGSDGVLRLGNERAAFLQTRVKHLNDVKPHGLLLVESLHHIRDVPSASVRRLRGFARNHRDIRRWSGYSSMLSCAVLIGVVLIGVTPYSPWVAACALS